mmetsp:Transcript_81724/g.236944  ORF Transcript_81724/g.236944 Transcript_81724/m.236944 type:complete len:816 (-) Transcript_81724:68-2515(-)
MEHLLLHLGNEAFSKDNVDLLISSFAGEQTDMIPYTQFLEWCSIADGAITQAATISLVVRDKDGSKVEALRVSLYDSCRQVKRRVMGHCHQLLACDCAPVECQQLKLFRHGPNGRGCEEASLSDFDVLLASTTAGDTPWEMELQLVQPPPLSMLDFACIVAGKEPLDTALTLAFCGRDVTEPLASTDSAASPASPSRGSGAGVPGSSPLASLPSIRAPHQRLAATARWLLARGAGHHAEDVTGAVNECLLHCNASVLQELMKAEGYEPLAWEQVVQGVFSASCGLSRTVEDDAISRLADVAGDDVGPLGADAREMLAERLDAEVKEATELLDFVDILRRRLLPAVSLPPDLLSRPALLGCGGEQQEVMIGELGAVGASLLLGAAHRGQCWALAELTRRGVTWESSLGGKCKPGGLSVHWLKSAAIALEDQFRAVLNSMALRVAILRGDAAVATTAALAADGCISASWSEGPLITAARCGVRRDVLDVLLQRSTADPNLGCYEYRGKGAFALMSPLGWLARSAASFRKQQGGEVPKAVNNMIERLVAHPFTDLEFGRVSGEGTRSECLLETTAHCFRCAGLWSGLLCLLQMGAPPGGVALHDPRLHANGGSWGKVDQPEDSICELGQVEWLDALEQQLEGESASSEDVAQKVFQKQQAVARLLKWLRYVRRKEFVFPSVQSFPAPFRTVAKSLLRHMVQRSSPRRPALPLRALERVLSFVGFWEFPTGRPCYTRELHLRRIDGYSRTCGLAGCPVYDRELMFSGCQLRLSDWAEDKFRARCASVSPVATPKSLPKTEPDEGLETRLSAAADKVPAP